MILIEADSLSKNYGNINIFKSIDLFIEENKSYAITGNSGTGKSTLLNILSLLDTATSGVLKIKNQNVSTFNENEKAKLRNSYFGFIFQRNNLLNDYSVLENIMLPALINKKSSTAEIKEKAIALLKKINLNDKVSCFPNQLSGGECQRVAICRSLVNDPKIIFADEPTGSLDEDNAKKIENLMFDLVSNYGKTLILVTHNNNFASRCDKRFVIRNHNLECMI